MSDRNYVEVEHRFRVANICFAFTLRHRVKKEKESKKTSNIYKRVSKLLRRNRNSASDSSLNSSISTYQQNFTDSPKR